MTVVIVQHEPSVPPGLISEVLEERSVDYRIFEAWRETDWPNIEDVTALIVMGGTMNVDDLERFPFLAQSRALMSSALDTGTPTLGVCLGSQMMARVLGSDVRRADRRNASFSAVKVTDDGVGDPLLKPFSTGVPVLQFHEDTFTVPEDAVALASSESSGLAQAFRYGEVAYAIQFHFEVDRPILEGWIGDIGEPGMTQDWGTSGAELLSSADSAIAPQDEAGRDLMRRFLDLLGR